MSTHADGCGKQSYRKRDAQTVRNRLRKRGVVLRIYRCPKSNFWHLTHDLSDQTRAVRKRNLKGGTKRKPEGLRRLYSPCLSPHRRYNECDLAEDPKEARLEPECGKARHRVSMRYIQLLCKL